MLSVINRYPRPPISIALTGALLCEECRQSTPAYVVGNWWTVGIFTL